VLIDRSLVLGTVDRPQLHDVMLEFVKKELAGEQYKRAQRRLVDALRNADRSTASASGKYMQLYIKHHIAESYDEVWGKSTQSMSWLEDQVKGMQDCVAISTASVLPDVQALATDAEDAKLWWSAALRWNALACAKMDGGGSLTAGKEFLERAVQASVNIAVPTDGGTRDASYCTQFDLDCFNLHTMSTMVMSWDPAALAAYGEKIRKLTASEAGKSNPILLIRIFTVMEWFPSLLSGTPDTYVSGCLKWHNMFMDTMNEKTDVYFNLSEEERHLLKPMTFLCIILGSDSILRLPDFAMDCFGKNGDLLLEWSNAYSYNTHHTFMCRFVSLDCWLAYNMTDWPLTLQFGRVSDAVSILEKRLRVLEKAAADTSSPGYATTMPVTISQFLVCCHVHGQQQMARKLFGIIGITFDSVGDYLSTLTKDNALYSSMEQMGAGGGLVSLKRLCWHIKSFLVMHADVPAAKAIAWLESFGDDETFYQVSMTMPHYDHGGFWGANHQTCWIALAHEKVGLYDGALRFCRLALGTDLLKAGVPFIKWAQVIASACKGRVLTKLNRHTEALVAFQAAIITSKESYPMIEALAYRELVNCGGAAADVPALLEAAAQAAKDLEEKLKEFDGRLTRAEFDTLTIAPP
jgi:hypothetical protein